MRIALLLFVLFISSCIQNTHNEQNIIHSQQKTKIIIPERQEIISLEKFVDWGAKQGNLQKLSKVSLPKGDFEIRFWITQGVGNRVGTSGIIIKKSGKNLSAFNVDKMLFNDDREMENHLVFPKSDWQNLLQQLTELEIFTLPDSWELKEYKGNHINDGCGYLVEINKDGVYRIYEYANPSWAENAEAKQIVKIGNLIADEFRLEEFRNREK